MIFWEKVEKTSTCWLWKGYVRRDGYGQAGRNVKAHRYAYEQLVGPLGSLVPDHLCKVRHCVNPEHMEAVTPEENVSRGDNWHRAKTHCKNGHPFTEESWRTTVRKGKKSQERRCWECFP